MEEIKNELVSVSYENNSLGITKGYGYVNKDGKQRYSFNEYYYKDADRICRKHSNERGEFYYNVDLIDVVVETYPLKDGTMITKVYPLSETAYLAKDASSVDTETLSNYLMFKLHR